jgi:hypothetical protein
MKGGGCLLRSIGKGLLLFGALACVSAAAQDPTVAFPKNYRVVLDNADVVVLRAHYGPHESVGVHDHSDHPTVYVYLNDSGPVRFVHEPEGVMLTRPPTHTGAYRVSPGRRERHSLVNLSDRPSDYLRVELKRVPLGAIKQEFRGAAPEPPLKQGTTVEFDDQMIRIERVVCDAGAACAMQTEGAPSVLVAFTPTEMRTGRRWRPFDSESPVVWLAQDGAASVRANGPEQAQLLRIVLLQH